MNPHRGPFRYCPYCAGELELLNLPGEHRPRLVCGSCGEVIYQNPKPVVAAVIERGGKVLLARRARGAGAGKWDLPGGFVEMDETAEEALTREVKEEVGCRITILGVLGVFREEGGSFGPSLNIHFRASALEEPRATEEVSEVRWFGPHELPPQEEVAFENDVEALEMWKKIASLEGPT